MSAFAATPRRHVAVFVFADFGHLSPTLGLTRELIRRGHRVTYFVDHQYREVVERTDARAVVYTSRRGAFAKVPDADAARMAAEGHDLLVESMERVYPLALSTLAADPPDLVLYDFESFPAARMIAHTLGGVPTVQLGISHVSNEVFSMRRLLLDPDAPSMREGGAALMRFAGNNGLAPDGLARFLREWDDRNLAFLPREFQIEGTTFDESYVFVGPTVTAPEEDVPWSPPADGRRTALVSLGTESNRQRDFFRTCADAFDGAEWQVVMTLGREADLAGLGDLPPHVQAHRWLPHPAVLPHADVLVCHGGMSCLMEALHFATPVVVVPQGFEHTLTARRVAELGLGRMIDRDRLTADTLGAAVGDIVADPEIPERMAWMRASVRAAGGAARAARLLEQWADPSASTVAT
ncbi:macrolide family glycosyltransferase [Streptomyces sp. NPDC048611]|uniref:macrolide family glycosyltransferase n=1 Tax=Streptomyces sp. NPDC048611 TaxID=3155635 RepID=UPI0034242755